MSCFHTRTLSSRRVKRALKRLGCEQQRATGRHLVYATPTGKAVSVPLSHPLVSARSLRHAIEQAEMDWHELLKQY